MIDHSLLPAWSVAVWILSDEKSPYRGLVQAPRMVNWQGAEAWDIELSFKPGLKYVSRRADVAFLCDGVCPLETNGLKLSEVPVSADKLRQIQNAYMQANEPSSCHFFIAFRLPPHALQGFPLG